MRPVPVPKYAIEANPEGIVQIISGPNGDLTGDIRPVDSLIVSVEMEDNVIAPCVNIYCCLEDDDLEKLKAGALVRIGWIGLPLHPFNITVDLED